MNDLIKRHRDFVTSLENNEKILLVNEQFSVNEQSSTSLISKLGFPQVVVDFYAQISQCKLIWNHNSKIDIEFLDQEIDFVDGEFNLSSERDFINGIDRMYLEDEYYVNLDLYSDDLHPFESIEDEYITCLVKGSNQLVYIDLGESEVYDLSVDLETYLDIGYQCYFFYGWQKAVFLRSKLDSDRLVHYLSQLIPGYKLNI